MVKEIAVYLLAAPLLLVTTLLATVSLDTVLRLIGAAV